MTRGLAFLLCLAPALVGTGLALLSACFSVMAFDAPTSTSQIWPYAVVVSALLASIACCLLLARSFRLMQGGSTRAACLYLAPPAVLAGVIVAFLRG